MKVLIIEDETYVAKSLETKLKKLRPNIEIIGITTDIPDSKKAIASHPDLDIVFSDIKLDDGLSFSVFDDVKTSAHVIFTTAFDEYALKAFDYNALDYIVKPFSEDSLERALSRCEKKYVGTVNTSKRIFIERGLDTVVCDVDSICYIIVRDGSTRVYLCDGLWGDVNRPLAALAMELPQEKFIRINRQVIVNIDSVDRISAGPGRDSTVSLKEPFSDISFIITHENRKRLLEKYCFMRNIL